MSENFSNAKITFDEDDLPFAPQFDDHYYSRNDGRAECAHVFINGNNLPQRWTELAHDGRIVVGELGFGTGLNFLETWRQWRVVRKPGQHLTFSSVEGFPLGKDDVRKALSVWPELHEDVDRLLADWSNLGSPISIDENTVLDVHLGLATDEIPNFPKVDVWYLDGFSPAKNPDMWSVELMKALGEQTKPGGSFASYTAAGWVRRNLEEAGFSVKKLPGFGRKRDMISGEKP